MSHITYHSNFRNQNDFKETLKSAKRFTIASQYYCNSTSLVNQISAVKVKLECRCIDRENENEKIEFKNSKYFDNGINKSRKLYPTAQPVFLEVTEHGHVIGLGKMD